MGLKPFPFRAPKTLLHCLLVSSIADQSDFQTLLIFISSPSFSLVFPLELRQSNWLLDFLDIFKILGVYML